MCSNASKPCSDAGFQGDARAQGHALEGAPACTVERRYTRPLFGHGLVGNGRLGYSLADILGISRKHHSGGIRGRIQSFWHWLQDTVQRPWCYVVGCRYDAPEFRSWCLYTCTRCGCEMFGRTFDDLPSAPIDDDTWWEEGR